MLCRSFLFYALLIYSVSKPFPSQQFLIFDTHFFAPPFLFIAWLFRFVAWLRYLRYAFPQLRYLLLFNCELCRAFPMQITAHRFLSIAPQFSSSPFHIDAVLCPRHAVPCLCIPSHASSAHFPSIPRPHNHVLYSFIVSSESFSQVNFPFPEFLHWPSPRHTP